MTDKAKNGSINAADMQARGARTEMLKKELGAVIDELEDRVLTTFKLSDPHDQLGHQSCRFYLELLQDFRHRMEYRIETGKQLAQDLPVLN